MAEPFDPLPAASLSREDIVSFLVELRDQGWQVFAKEKSFFIIIDDLAKIEIEYVHNWAVVYIRNAVGRDLHGGKATNLIQLRAIVAQSLPRSRPSKIRLTEGEPASNLSRISKLIGTSMVLAVHDPYLDDRGLDTLRCLLGLGTGRRIAADARFLTSKNGAQKLSQQFKTAFFAELQCSAAQLRCIQDGKPHRRFMLLSGGQCLIMGMSLNNIDKNEALHLEADTEDRGFFENEWAKATLI